MILFIIVGGWLISLLTWNFLGAFGFGCCFYILCTSKKQNINERTEK